MLRDVRHCLRIFRRSPAFSVTVILTLALGIGLTTAIFSVVYGVLLRPLPYSDPSTLVTGPSVSSDEWSDWRRRTSALDDVALYDFGVPQLLFAGEETARIRQAAVSPNLLSVLGVRPILGRDFRSADSEPAAEPVVMLTHPAWQRYFGSRPEVVGTIAAFDPAGRRVIGVLPADFVFPMRFLAVTGEVRMLTPLPRRVPQGSTFMVVARLKRGATLAQARGEALAVVPRLARESRASAVSNVTTLAEVMLGGSRQSLMMLFGAVGFLLLIACANVGNLLFAKGAEARRELAVRFALGARRCDLARLIVIQSCTLTIVGGLLGVLLAYAGFDVLKSFVPPELPRASDVRLDIPVLGFAFFLSLISGATIGLFPAWHLSRGELQPMLQGQDRATLPAQRFRMVVLGTEVAMSVVLLSGAALFARSFVRLLGVDPGFVPRNVLALHVRKLDSRYPRVEQQRAFLDETLDRIAAQRGVTSVAAIEMLPATRARRGGSVVALDRPVADPITAEPRVISPGYFETMRIGLVLGRPFNRGDASGAPQVAIVNEALARRLWPAADPIGRRIRYENEEPREVIGIVRDVRTYAVDTTPEPQVYIPYSQTWLAPQQLVIRTDADPSTFVAAVRRQIREVDSRASGEDIQLLTDYVAASIAQPRFQAWLLGTFAGSGLILAIVGVGGVVAYTVSRRRREIGIRIALGASGRDVLRTVMVSSLVAVAIGLSIGMATAFALGRLARAFLFEVEPHDPLTLTAVVALLGTTAVAAAWLPARRATRTDPVLALRAE
ncbi:MAG: hypothetical protein DMF84_30690 [Acidobacteria bacterium]|nr:MAG: hypothetical protein DMF84_30690 [Acidobacteriota bacterium]